MLTSLHPKVTPGVFCFFLKSNHSCWDYPWNAILNCKVEFRGSSFVLHFKNHKVCFFFIVKIIYSCNQNVAINININIKMLTFCYMVCPSCHLKEYENWLIKYSSSTFMREGLYRAPGIQGSSPPPTPAAPVSEVLGQSWHRADSMCCGPQSGLEGGGRRSLSQVRWGPSQDLKN